MPRARETWRWRPARVAGSGGAQNAFSPAFRAVRGLVLGPEFTRVAGRQSPSGLTSTYVATSRIKRPSVNAVRASWSAGS
jgi:hypothetical protein